MKLRDVSIALVLGVAGAGCRHRVNDRPVPLPANWQYCWWTVVRSTLPAGTVAANFRRAFVTVGLPNIHWTRSGDTIWVRGGPAPIPPSQLLFDTASHGATYWSRAVVFSQGDSTHCRLYSAIIPPADGSARAVREATRAPSGLPVCEAVARAAGVRWIKRAGDPGDEERLPVWSRVP